MRRKISAHVDGGLSGGSRVRGPGSEDPHRHERIFFSFLFSSPQLYLSWLVKNKCLLGIVLVDIYSEIIGALSI